MSAVSIVNQALREIGSTTRITSLTEGSNEANVANDLYDPLLEDLLRAHPWNFATRRQQLAKSARTPSHEFDHQYPVPDDYLRTHVVSGSNLGATDILYRLASDPDDGLVILTSADEVWLTYIAKITDTTLMPPDFKTALAFRLAQPLALTLAQSNTLSELMKRRFDEALAAAKSTDGIEDFPEARPEGSWTTVRRSGLREQGIIR